MLSAFLIHLLRLNSRPMPSCKRWHTKKATDNGMQLLPQLLPLPDSWPGPLKERLRVLHSELHERIQREETSRVGIPGDTAKDIKGHRKVTEVTEERLWR